MFLHITDVSLKARTTLVGTNASHSKPTSQEEPPQHFHSLVVANNTVDFLTSLCSSRDPFQEGGGPVPESQLGLDLHYKLSYFEQVCSYKILLDKEFLCVTIFDMRLRFTISMERGHGEVAHLHSSSFQVLIFAMIKMARKGSL